MIRVDGLWLAVEPLDLRAGTESARARVAAVFGAARPHHAYLFTNRRANRMKVLVHDGIGVWRAARRLNSGKFVWPKDASGKLTLGRAWRRARARPTMAAHRRGRCHHRAVAASIATYADGGPCEPWARSRLVIADELDRLDPEQLRQALRAARAEVAQREEMLQRREREVAFKQAVIDKLTHENAILKQLKFATHSEALEPGKPTGEKKQPRREPLPPHMPRR